MSGVNGDTSQQQALIELVREIWADVLEMDPDGIDPESSDFFELGGYSLLALQAITRVLQVRYGEEADTLELEGTLLSRLFDTPTVSAQVECLLTSGAHPTTADDASR